MNHERAFIGCGSQPKPSTDMPQRFHVRLRRGNVYTYVTESGGESQLLMDAKDFGDHRLAHVESQIRLREVGVDGTEVEMVTKT